MPKDVDELDIRILKGKRNVTDVREGDELSIEVYNRGEHLEDALLVVGNQPVYTIQSMAKGQRVVISYTAGDFIGASFVQIKGPTGTDICVPKKINVAPRHMLIGEYETIKNRRIPDLIKKFNADNVIQFVYEGGSTTMDVDVLEFSTDQLLNHYCDELFTISKDILDNLDYRSKSITKGYKASMRGKVNWAKTSVYQSSKGMERQMGHVCVRRKKTFNTPGNAFLLMFHYVLFKDVAHIHSEIERREIEKIKWKDILGYSGRDFDPDALELLTTLKVYMKRHKALLLKGHFKEILPAVRSMANQPQIPLVNAKKDAIKSKNRAYKRMLELWDDFDKNYTSSFDDIMTVDTQRTEDVYEFWVVCEIVNALGLFSLFSSVREFVDRENNNALYYQKMDSLKETWLADEDSGPIEELNKPDILVRFSDVEIYISTVYDPQKKGVPKEKVYQVLGQMSTSNVSLGIIFYPGNKISVKHNPGSKQVLVVAPLRMSSDVDIGNINMFAVYIRSLFEFIAKASNDIEKGEKINESIAELKEEWAPIAQ